jgi:hypothetical protein
VNAADTGASATTQLITRLLKQLITEDKLRALVDRLTALGASTVREVDQGPAGHWWLMRDPEGNEFRAA